MKEIVLLTGATGFVGRQVLNYLLRIGWLVRLVVRDGKQSEFEGRRGIVDVLATPDLFAEKKDWWQEACQGVTTVIHVAWYAEPGLYLQSEKNFDCFLGTIELAKGAVLAGVKRFIGIGTCFEYDVSIGILSIETPLRPLTVYAAAKASTFMILSQWLPSQNTEFAWCRLFYLYGAHEDERRLVPFIRKKLSSGETAELTSGKQIRDFLDVKIAGKWIVEIALGKHQGPVNICSGIPVTVRQLAEQVADEFGRRDLLKFGARPDNLIDPPCIVGVRVDPVER